MKYNVGIIGRGFVGNAILSHLKKQDCVHVMSYDINDDIPIDTGYSGIVESCELIYICLPTPPDKYPDLTLICNPEFLTERTSEQDVTNTTKHLIGLTGRSAMALTRDYHERAWPNSKCVFTTASEAELIKYTTNTFFSLKIIFANLLFNLCSKIDVDYSYFIESALNIDERLGSLHWEVPGHDGSFGFGGACLPKDLRGMVKILEEKDIDASLLKVVQDSNLTLRQEEL